MKGGHVSREDGGYDGPWESQEPSTATSGPSKRSTNSQCPEKSLSHQARARATHLSQVPYKHPLQVADRNTVVASGSPPGDCRGLTSSTHTLYMQPSGLAEETAGHRGDRTTRALLSVWPAASGVVATDSFGHQGQLATAGCSWLTE